MPDPVQDPQTQTLLTDDKSVAAETPEQKAAAEAAAKAAAETPEQKAAREAAQTPEQKAAAEAAAKAAAEKAKQGAPEKYEAFKAPQGVAIDAATSTEFGTLAKELNLSQEGAQKVYDLGAKISKQASDKVRSDVAAAVTQWAADAKADNEIGGEKFDENLGVAKTGLEKHGTPELKKLLKESGLGNHPEFIRHFVRLGKAHVNDKTVLGADGKPSPSAQGFYENSKHNP